MNNATATAPRRFSPTPTPPGADRQIEEIIRRVRQHIERDARHRLDTFEGRHRNFYTVVSGIPVVQFYRIFSSIYEDKLLYEEEHLYNAVNELGVRIRWFDSSTGQTWKQVGIVFNYTYEYDPVGNLLYWDVKEIKI